MERKKQLESLKLFLNAAIAGKEKAPNGAFFILPILFYCRIPESNLQLAND